MAAPYEEGFLLSLMLLALAALAWLFAPFIPALFFAVLLATATFPMYSRLVASFSRFREGKTLAAIAMVMGLVFLVILPFMALLIEGSIKATDLYGSVQAWLQAQNVRKFEDIYQVTLAWLPLSQETLLQAKTYVQGHLSEITGWMQTLVLALTKGILTNTFSSLTFLGLTLFALFFFYLDGPVLLHRLKVLSPLPNYLDRLIFIRFSKLSTVLSVSVVSIALVQGVIFSVVASFFDLPWLFLGLAIAMTSFIPIVGSAMVWLPTSLYLLSQGNMPGLVTLVATGAIVNGVLVDNFLRPYLLAKLAAALPDDPRHPADALHHTLITVLSTFAGLLHFGMMGLFFGPMIAAMAITVFDVYAIRHGDDLDQS